MEGNGTVNDDRKIAIIMNKYFTNITEHTNLMANKISHQEEPMNILGTFKSHESVQKIKLANFDTFTIFQRSLKAKLGEKC